ncbi:MAG TPA: hypothetical protein PK668_14845 [Myxococcota bacterium]|nr:hypothetical protein [Myxococcota bacterium]HRY94171.1 hypothetical protein [Myxococcota bacterium]HSA20495.1 hypothetical protein [Myxococcota bacterium]
MTRLRERIPREKFEDIFRPMVREVGSREVILRINAAAHVAIPRQTKLADLMPKLAVLAYEREKPQVDEALETLWGMYFEHRLGEGAEAFDQASEALNKSLEQDRVPTEPDKRAVTAAAIGGLVEVLKKADFSDLDVEAVFRIKAFPEVLALYLERPTAG